MMLASDDPILPNRIKFSKQHLCQLRDQYAEATSSRFQHRYDVIEMMIQMRENAIDEAHKKMNSITAQKYFRLKQLKRSLSRLRFYKEFHQKRAYELQQVSHWKLYRNFFIFYRKLFPIHRNTSPTFYSHILIKAWRLFKRNIKHRTLKSTNVMVLYQYQLNKYLQPCLVQWHLTIRSKIIQRIKMKLYYDLFHLKKSFQTFRQKLFNRRLHILTKTFLLEKYLTKFFQKWQDWSSYHHKMTSIIIQRYHHKIHDIFRQWITSNQKGRYIRIQERKSSRYSINHQYMKFWQTFKRYGQRRSTRSTPRLRLHRLLQYWKHWKEWKKLKDQVSLGIQFYRMKQSKKCFVVWKRRLLKLKEKKRVAKELASSPTRRMIRTAPPIHNTATPSLHPLPPIDQHLLHPQPSHRSQPSSMSQRLHRPSIIKKLKQYFIIWKEKSQQILSKKLKFCQKFYEKKKLKKYWTILFSNKIFIKKKFSKNEFKNKSKEIIPLWTERRKGNQIIIYQIYWQKWMNWYEIVKQLNRRLYQSKKFYKINLKSHYLKKWIMYWKDHQLQREYVKKKISQKYYKKLKSNVKEIGIVRRKKYFDKWYQYQVDLKEMRYDHYYYYSQYKKKVLRKGWNTLYQLKEERIYHDYIIYIFHTQQVRKLKLFQFIQKWKQFVLHYQQQLQQQIKYRKKCHQKNIQKIIVYWKKLLRQKKLCGKIKSIIQIKYHQKLNKKYFLRIFQWIQTGKRKQRNILRSQKYFALVRFSIQFFLWRKYYHLHTQSMRHLQRSQHYQLLKYWKLFQFLYEKFYKTKKVQRNLLQKSNLFHQRNLLRKYFQQFQRDLLRKMNLFMKFTQVQRLHHMKCIQKGIIHWKLACQSFLLSYSRGSRSFILRRYKQSLLTFTSRRRSSQQMQRSRRFHRVHQMYQVIAQLQLWNEKKLIRKYFHQKSSNHRMKHSLKDSLGRWIEFMARKKQQHIQFFETLQAMTSNHQPMTVSPNKPSSSSHPDYPYPLTTFSVSSPIHAIQSPRMSPSPQRSPQRMDPSSPSSFPLSPRFSRPVSTFGSIPRPSHRTPSKLSIQPHRKSGPSTTLSRLVSIKSTSSDLSLTLFRIATPSIKWMEHPPHRPSYLSNGPLPPQLILGTPRRLYSPRRLKQRMESTTTPWIFCMKNIYMSQFYHLKGLLRVVNQWYKSSRLKILHNKTRSMNRIKDMLKWKLSKGWHHWLDWRQLVHQPSRHDLNRVHRYRLTAGWIQWIGTGNSSGIRRIMYDRRLLQWATETFEHERVLNCFEILKYNARIRMKSADWEGFPLHNRRSRRHPLLDRCDRLANQKKIRRSFQRWVEKTCLKQKGGKVVQVFNRQRWIRHFGRFHHQTRNQLMRWQRYQFAAQYYRRFVLSKPFHRLQYQVQLHSFADMMELRRKAIVMTHWKDQYKQRRHVNDLLQSIGKVLIQSIYHRVLHIWREAIEEMKLLADYAAMRSMQQLNQSFQIWRKFNKFQKNCTLRGHLVSSRHRKFHQSQQCVQNWMHHVKRHRLFLFQCAIASQCHRDFQWKLFFAKLQKLFRVKNAKECLIFHQKRWKRTALHRFQWNLVMSIHSQLAIELALNMMWKKCWQRWVQMYQVSKFQWKRMVRKMEGMMTRKVDMSYAIDVKNALLKYSERMAKKRVMRRWKREVRIGVVLEKMYQKMDENRQNQLMFGYFKYWRRIIRRRRRVQRVKLERNEVQKQLEMKKVFVKLEHTLLQRWSMYQESRLMDIHAKKNVLKRSFIRFLTSLNVMRRSYAVL